MRWRGRALSDVAAATRMAVTGRDGGGRAPVAAAVRCGAGPETRRSRVHTGQARGRAPAAHRVTPRRLGHTARGWWPRSAPSLGERPAQHGPGPSGPSVLCEENGPSAGALLRSRAAPCDMSTRTGL